MGLARRQVGSLSRAHRISIPLRWHWSMCRRLGHVWHLSQLSSRHTRTLLVQTRLQMCSPVVMAKIGKSF